MHGFALYQIMSRFDRANVGQMSSKKEIEMVKAPGEEDFNISRLEQLSVREKFQLNMFNRFK